MKKILHTTALLLSFAALGSTAHAQYVKSDRLLSFEQELPAGIDAQMSQYALSDAHFRDGKQSLAWTFQPHATLSFHRDLQFEPKDPTGKDLYLSCFVVWVYNEKAQDKQLQFQFLKDGKLCTSFPFGINFTGWRAAWVVYERDMQGTPQPGMNELKIVAPDVAGKLYFDHILTGAKVDPRQQTADLQVPFVNKKTTNHWLMIYPHSLWKSDLELQPVTAQDKADLQKIEQRYLAEINPPKKITPKECEAIRKAYNAYRIVYRDGQVSGEPIYFVRHSEAYERFMPNWNKDFFTRQGVEMRNYFDLMKRVAIAYLNTQDTAVREEMRQKFVTMYDNITDQGVAYGSCWGNIHHYGYSIRSLFTAYLLMKDVLRQEGKLNDAIATLNWYAITNEVFEKPTANGIDMDSFNTKSPGRLASILIMEDSPEKIRLMRSFSRWIDYGCRPSEGLAGSFKRDGAAFHHCNLYPAYAVGGLDGATSMIYYMSGTRFAVSQLAHETVNKVLLAMRFYCNTYQWPLAISGRHPNGSGQLIPIEYGKMALAGTPDGKQKYDPEMAAAYLRLIENSQKVAENAPEYLPKTAGHQEKQIKNELLKAGFKAEADPQGNLSLGYGCLGVQRRANWSATVRGFSRYLWCAEHYLNANFYGRYLSYGSLQLLNGKPGEPVNFKTSGWQQNGFDWNRIPGTTTIHLPFEKLRAVVLNVDTYSGMEEMLYSDEAFAGALSQQKENGCFGMKLHEHDKYNGSHRARISYHFFDDKIVALGSDIENNVTDYPTETTIFQLAVNNEAAEKHWQDVQKNANQHTYLDPNGVGYYVPGTARFIQAYPQTTVGERHVKPTQGNWVSLIVEHGKAPKAARYEYAIKMRTDAQQLAKFAKKPGYQVLQQDKNAHIVRDRDLNATSYVLFETPQTTLPGQLILQSDTSCLAMVRVIDKQHQVLTVAQPDLALYRGNQSDDIYDANGKRIERSIYSRPWKDDASQPIDVTITLKGEWKLPETADVEALSAPKGCTRLRFHCSEAKSYDVVLEKK